MEAIPFLLCVCVWKMLHIQVYVHSYTLSQWEVGLTNNNLEDPIIQKI